MALELRSQLCTFENSTNYNEVKVKVKVKLRFSAPSAGIAEIEQT